MLELLFKKKYLIIFVAIIFMLGGFSRVAIVRLFKVTMQLSINYPGAEKGLNPDGTKFNVFEITSNDVLDRALKKANINGMTVDYLKGRVDIYAHTATNLSERIKTANILGKDFSYIPNEYTISYSQKDKFSESRARDILNAISKSYTEIFTEKYTDKDVVLSNWKIDKDKYEYLELAQLYENKVDSMIKFLEERSSENGSYRSAQTNQTFQDIIFVLQNLKKINIGNLKAYISTSGLAKDRQSYINKLKYEVDTLNIDYARASREMEFVKDAITKYDTSVADAIFIPSLDKNNDFYMNRTKIGLDYLTTRAYDAGIVAEGLLKTIDQKNKIITDFSQTKTTPDEYKRLENRTNEMMTDIETKFADISKTALETNKEYTSYKTRGYLKFSIPAFKITDIINISNLIYIFLWGLLGFAFIVALLVLMKKLEPVFAFAYTTTEARIIKPLIEKISSFKKK